MIGSYYFWKWADNDLPGRPVEVHGALTRGEMHPALAIFDARKLLKNLDRAAVSGRKRREEWDWQVTHDGSPRRTRFVFFTCPQINARRGNVRRFSDLFAWLGVSGFDEQSGQVIPCLRPKLNCFITGQIPEDRSYDITTDDLPYLIRRIDPCGGDPFGIIEDSRGYFVQCRTQGRRFIVEWAENQYSRTGTIWDQCRAQDRGRLAALDVPYDKDTPPGKDPDLLLYAEVLRIFQAFLRRESRPPRYHWMNINSWVSK